ncbi:MAG: HAMP domain-containing sensor histidine kinase [Desulfosarcinaceae bacterium]|nr:HAMP domain-containing sensor histidine kinase [Desulfosarcinaceae bacterium]
MDTCFAPARRTAPDTLFDKIEIVNRDPVVTGLLHNLGGLLAVLDANRQIVALNDALLAHLGIDDPAQALGLRPGQALACIHAQAPPSGCGTTQVCTTCGAAIAIVASLAADRPEERLCALKADGDGAVDERILLVRSQPLHIEDRRFLLLSIQDVSEEQRRAALERTFFHDINNLLGILSGTSEMLLEEHPGELAQSIHQVVQCLKSEVHLQTSLMSGSFGDDTPLREPLHLSDLITDLKRLFADHPAARELRLRVSLPSALPVIRSDRAALLRILGNMLINAFEASEPGSDVKLRVATADGHLRFSVWNRAFIPPAVQMRLFQRGFSTKGEKGRGIGTYSMKLIGEKLLGGQVSCTSSEMRGTTFGLRLPLASAIRPGNTPACRRTDSGPA